MLTRHFYNRDSVGKALQQAAAPTGRDPLRKQKLLFWTYELVLSEEWDYLWGILEKVALNWGNSDCLKAVQPQSTDPNTVLQFLQSLLALPSFTPLEPPASVGADDSVAAAVSAATPTKPAAWTPHQRHRLWRAVRDALAHRRPLRLLALLGGIPSATAVLYLGCPVTGGGGGGRWKEKGIYHLLEMVDCPTLPTPSPPNPLSWPDIPIGRKAARLFSIPRGLQATVSTTAGIFDPPVGCPGTSRSKGTCAFWRRVWETEDEDTIWSKYFPDDVPDEWSAEELAKS